MHYARAGCAKLLFELGGKILVNAPDVANRCPALYADRHDQFDFLEWIMEKHGAVKEIRRGDAKRRPTRRFLRHRRGR